MRLYRYDEDGCLLENFEAYLDPEESKKQGKEVYMLPANCTKEIPPKVKENEIAIFKSDKWEVVEDFRGKFQCNSDFEISIIDYVGKPPEGFIVITEEQAKEIINDKMLYIIQDGQLVENPNYDQYLYKEREDYFNENFFLTSLGWIRRKVTMKDKSTKDFLTDLLPSIQLGMSLKQDVTVITYKKPDFSKDLTEKYMISLQEKKIANESFINECLLQILNDFTGGN